MSVATLQSTMLYPAKAQVVVSALAVGLVSLALFAPLLRPLVLMENTDYPAHTEAAVRTAESGRLQSPHPLNAMFSVALQSILQVQHMATIAFLALCIYFATLAAALFLLLSRETGWNSAVGHLCIGLLTLSLMLVAPIYVSYLDSHRYLGYIGINVYHNPTIAMLKPIALLTLGYAVRVFRSDTPASQKQVCAAILLVMFGTAAKPSYIVCLLPALAVFASIAYLRNRPIDWRLLLVGIVLPGVAMLVEQYLYTYNSAPDGAGVMFAPFLVFGLLSDNLAPKFVLSFLFPAVVYLAYLGRSNRDILLNFSWLTFGFGAFLTYFMAESGGRLTHANFSWSGQISLFLLFVASASFATREIRAAFVGGWSTRRFCAALICASAFALHLGSGLSWYLIYLTTPEAPQW